MTIGPARVFNLPIILGVLALLFLVASLSYFSPWLWKIFSETLQKLPAAIFTPAEKKEKEFPIPEVEIPDVEREYIEVAEAGEGITHLARRALKKYLQENPQDFEVTAEHKIYIEDYIQKKTDDDWLILRETLTFSEELIVEAINKDRQLTPDQLENLKQYSQLVSSF